jgi:predicted dehydrogenase
MTETVRVGIIGTSFWADFMFLSSLQSHPQAQLVAICGRNAERAGKMAKKYAIPQVFTDYRALIEQAKLDALIVAAPDDLHYPITMMALDRGLHVLCEKPLARNADHARAMYEKATAMQVKHMVCFTWRWLPHAQYLHQLIKEGYVGRPFHSEFRYLAGYGRSGKYGWRFDGQRANGILGDLGSHMIDLARWYGSEIARVSAHVSTHVARQKPDGGPMDRANDAALLTVEFANGAQGVIQVSAVAHIAERFMHQSLAFYGADGSLEADCHFGGAQAGGLVRGVRNGEEQFRPLPVPPERLEEIDQTQPFDAFFQEWFSKKAVGARLFVNAILADRPVSPNFYDGLQAQVVIDAALESHRRGCWVSVAEELK